MDIQTGPSRIIRMKFGPQTFGGGDLRLQRPRSEQQKVYSGKEWPGNYVLKMVFHTARFLSGPDFTVFPRPSLEQLTQDLDYTLALYYLADYCLMDYQLGKLRRFTTLEKQGEFIKAVLRPSIEEIEKRGEFIKAILWPSRVEPADSVRGYERLMNNFSTKLGGGSALFGIDQQMRKITEQISRGQSSSVSEQWLLGLQRNREIYILINRVVEEKLGVKPEESGLSYKPGNVNWRESPSALLGKRRQLFMIFETLVCEHGVGIRELTA